MMLIIGFVVLVLGLYCLMLWCWFDKMSAFWQDTYIALGFCLYLWAGIMLVLATHQ